MNTTVKAWLYGLGAALITGVANAVTLAVVDPQTFPLDNLSRLGTVALVSGVLSVATYLKASPLPQAEQK